MREQTVFKRAVAAVIFVCFCICAFSGCANSYKPEVSDEIWDNSNAVYVRIASDYVETVFKNHKKAFSDIGLKAVFIVDKQLKGAYGVDHEPQLTLLLVLDRTGAENQAVALELLKKDERVVSARAVDDLPFEPINTLAFSESQIHAKVGDTLTLSVNGYSAEYAPEFDFGSIFPIILKKYDKNKTYTAADFPLAGGSSVEVMDLEYDDYLQLYLEAPNYFNAIKAVHAVAQNPNVLAVSLNSLYYPAVHYLDKWSVSDKNIVEITNLYLDGHNRENDIGGYYEGTTRFEELTPAEILCKQKGTVTVTFTQSLGWRMGGSTTCTIIVE